jgi:hypothetical protein
LVLGPPLKNPNPNIASVFMGGCKLIVIPGVTVVPPVNDTGIICFPILLVFIKEYKDSFLLS